MENRSQSTPRRRVLLWILLGTGLLLGAAAIVIVTVFDEDSLRDRFQATASDVLGLEVAIDGAMDLAIWPTPNISAADIVLEKDGAPIARFDAVRLDIALLPLLTGNLRIRHVNVDGADVEFRRDAAGQLNFQGPERGKVQARDVPATSFSAISVSYADEGEEARLHASGCGGRLSSVAIAEDNGKTVLGNLRAKGTLHCAVIEAQEFRFTDVESELSAREGLLQLDPISLRLFDGEGSGRVEGDFSGDLPLWSLHLELENFALEQFLRALEPEARAEGSMYFRAELSARGNHREALERSLAGSVSLRGETLTLHGGDLDQRLADYEATRRFGLLDAGALFFAGPAGLVVTRGREFARLLRGDEGKTELREVRSEWTVSEGVAEAADVAAATARNRLAARGRIDYAARSFDEFTVLLLDRQGCIVMEQSVHGAFEDPQIEEPGAIETVLGPLIDLVERGVAELVDEDCEVVYDGAVAHP
ncbi:MAG: AsmA family protein [Gammaproteobacteria bacterium]